MEIYDCIIIGGGPAGATAAIYLARFNRKVLVLDKKQGRSSYPQINENYFGFPEGIHARQLRELGKKQAERFGAEFVFDDVENVSKKDDLFEIISKNGKYFSKTLIIATGVKDEFPHFKGYEHCIGISLFWCITCDGHRTIDKDIAIIGHDNEAATTAMQFLNYTKKVCFINNSPNFKCEISEEKKK